MASFVELIIAYKSAEPDVDLASLGIKQDPEPVRTEKGIIDLDEVTGIYQSCDKPGMPFTDTNIELKNGNEYTIIMPYKEFKNLFQSLTGKQINQNIIKSDS